MLTREIRGLASNTHDAQAVVVGTYAQTARWCSEPQGHQPRDQRGAGGC